MIFDIDGVLVDSYAVHFQSWQMAAGRFGFVISERQFADTFGQTSRSIIRQLCGQEVGDGEVQEIDAYKEAAYRQIIAADFPTMPGAVELIDALAADGFALAVGSSGPPENVQLALDQLDRHALFDAQVSGADVTRGKPDPQVFQVAAQRLGIPPAACAVIEDAAAGVAAARAAGMLSVALVSTGHHIAEYDQADQIVQRLDQLSPAGLRQWITARRGDPRGVRESFAGE
ncbi:MAG: HAD-IA family hydrolase [Planctomycetales bacterium]|nr:HAD-IA family hydrolase [Planctomycetales bacterium]